MDSDTRKKSFWDMFTVTDQASCARAIRNGGMAAMISAAITSIFAIAGFFTQPADRNLRILLDPWLLVDVVLIVVLGIFIFRKSRIAATLMVIYFICGKIYLWTQLGNVAGLPLTIIFLLYYVTAMRGTYAWHSKYRTAPAVKVPDSPPLL